MRAPADSAVKAEAVRVLTEQLLPRSPLWPIYGERWREPRYFSLLMQPYIMSPAINLGDIAVALKLAPVRGCCPAARARTCQRWRDPPCASCPKHAALHVRRQCCQLACRTSARPAGPASRTRAGGRQRGRRCAGHAPLPHFRAVRGQGRAGPRHGPGGGAGGQPRHHLLSRPGGQQLPHFWSG